MKHYLEALFSVEYFPFWEGTMFFFLLYFVSISIRLNRMENKLDNQKSKIPDIEDFSHWEAMSVPGSDSSNLVDKIISKDIFKKLTKRNRK